MEFARTERPRSPLHHAAVPTPYATMIASAWAALTLLAVAASLFG